MRLKAFLNLALLAVAIGSTGSTSKAAERSPGFYSWPNARQGDPLYFERDRRAPNLGFPDWPGRGSVNGCECGGMCDGTRSNRWPSVGSPAGNYGTDGFYPYNSGRFRGPFNPGQCTDPGCACSQNPAARRYPMILPDYSNRPTQFGPAPYSVPQRAPAINRSPYFD